MFYLSTSSTCKIPPFADISTLYTMLQILVEKWTKIEKKKHWKINGACIIEMKLSLQIVKKKIV